MLASITNHDRLRTPDSIAIDGYQEDAKTAIDTTSHADRTYTEVSLSEAELSTLL